MEVIFKELENQGFIIECGVNEKFRRKKMNEAMKKLKESGRKRIRLSLQKD